MDQANLDTDAFDRALIGAAFALAAERGWPTVSVAAAARHAALPLAQARVRFPVRAALLIRFGRIADQAALADPPTEGSVRDKLFYLLMQRIDVLQAHRAGVLALMRAVPAEPAEALLLALATRNSMRWLLEAAGVSTAGLRGELRVKGMVGVWLWTLRTWRTDETADMSHTMAAADSALQRAEQAARWIGSGVAARRAAAAEEAAEEAEAPGETGGTAPELGPELPPEPLA